MAQGAAAAMAKGSSVLTRNRRHESEDNLFHDKSIPRFLRLGDQVGSFSRFGKVCRGVKQLSVHSGLEALRKKYLFFLG